tara:strand:+ start:97 stop:621 length:525 start_codon:yes stop_codon:yes gene_type:complete
LKNNLPENLIPMGEIIKPHGIKGELKVFLYNRESETLKKGVSIWFYSNNSYCSYKLISVRGSLGNSIMKIEQIENIDQVKRLAKKQFFISRNDFATIRDDSFYLNDLIGFNVFDNKNINYGKIIDIINLPANDVMIFMYKNKEIMIPIVDDFIELFDFENKLIQVKKIEMFLNL